jgi:hypothetical protein
VGNLVDNRVSSERPLPNCPRPSMSIAVYRKAQKWRVVRMGVRPHPLHRLECVPRWRRRDKSSKVPIPSRIRLRSRQREDRDRPPPPPPPRPITCCSHSLRLPPLHPVLPPLCRLLMPVPSSLPPRVRLLMATPVPLPRRPPSRKRSGRFLPARPLLAVDVASEALLSPWGANWRQRWYSPVRMP